MPRAISKKRRQYKSKFKWTKELIILIVFLCVIGLATGLMSIESKSTKLYNEITTAQTEQGVSTYLSEDNVFEKISYKDLKSKIKKDSYTYVYYGSMSDSTYLTYIQTVNEVAKKYDVKKVWLHSSSWADNLDLEDADDGEANNQKLVDRENSLAGVDLKQTPQFWVFKSGKLVFQASAYVNDTYQQAGWELVIEKAFGLFN